MTSFFNYVKRRIRQDISNVSLYESFYIFLFKLLPITIIVLGISALILYLPYKLIAPATSKEYDFSNTGQIGDTIGGITSPFIGLISAILVFVAFRQQIKANKLIIEGRDEDFFHKIAENSVSRFYKTFENVQVHNISDYLNYKDLEKYKGEEAIFIYSTHFVTFAKNLPHGYKFNELCQDYNSKYIYILLFDLRNVLDKIISFKKTSHTIKSYYITELFNTYQIKIKPHLHEYLQLLAQKQKEVKFDISNNFHLILYNYHVIEVYFELYLLQNISNKYYSVSDTNGLLKVLGDDINDHMTIRLPNIMKMKYGDYH